MVEQIAFDEFLKVDILVGTILEAEVNEKARKPAYAMKIDFGGELGIKSTSAQITEEHDLASLIGLQIVAVTNLPEKNVAGIVSEVLILAVVESAGRTILLTTTKPVKNGSRIL